MSRIFGRSLFRPFPDKAYKENKNAICEYNFKSLLSLAAYGSVIFLVLSVAGAFLEPLKNGNWVCAAAAACLAIIELLLLTVFKGKKNVSTVLLYISVAVILFAAILLGTVYLRTGYGVIFIGLITFLPSCILDKAWKLSALSVSTTLIFCIFAYALKENSIALMDSVNGVVFMIIGSFFASYTSKNRMSSIISKAQLEWNDMRYQAILIDTDDIIFDYNPATKKCYISDNVSNYFDVNIDYAALDKSISVFEEDKDKFYAMLQAIETSDTNAQGELRFITKDNTTKWFLVHIVALMNSEGNAKRIVGKITDIDSRKRNEELLKLMSQTDIATGVYNKAATEAIVSRELEADECSRCALLIVDVDNLKTINDTFGHAQGDKAILSVAQILKNHFRTSDIVGRVGGDEFMVLLKGAENSAAVRNLLEALVNKISLVRVGENDEWSISGSVGIAFRTDATGDFQSLYKMADDAMYFVKRNNKNGYAVYSDDLFS